MCFVFLSMCIYRNKAAATNIIYIYLNAKLILDLFAFFAMSARKTHDVRYVRHMWFDMLLAFAKDSRLYLFVFVFTFFSLHRFEAAFLIIFSLFEILTNHYSACNKYFL